MSVEINLKDGKVMREQNCFHPSGCLPRRTIFKARLPSHLKGGEIEIDQDMVFAEISPEIFTGNEDLAGDLDDRGENQFQNAKLVNNNA